MWYAVARRNRRRSEVLGSLQCHKGGMPTDAEFSRRAAIVFTTRIGRGMDREHARKGFGDTPPAVLHLN